MTKHQRAVPVRRDTGKWKVFRALSSNLAKTGNDGDPTFDRLTIVWVDERGVPFDTTGFNAVLTHQGNVVSRARFDPFGVARFANIRTPTRRAYRLQTFDRNGVLFRTRTIPVGVEAFAIIG